MSINPNVDLAKRLSILALAGDPSHDERSAAVNLFMGGAMLLAFHKKENPGANIDSIMDFVTVKCRETITLIMEDEANAN